MPIPFDPFTIATALATAGKLLGGGGEGGSPNPAATPVSLGDPAGAQSNQAQTTLQGTAAPAAAAAQPFLGFNQGGPTAPPDPAAQQPPVPIPVPPGPTPLGQEPSILDALSSVQAPPVQQAPGPVAPRIGGYNPSNNLQQAIASGTISPQMLMSLGQLIRGG